MPETDERARSPTALPGSAVAEAMAATWAIVTSPPNREIDETSAEAFAAADVETLADALAVREPVVRPVPSAG